MVAHSDTFPWPPYYGHFRFFEERMISHSHITNVEPQGGGVYELTDLFGKALRVFICECYSFGAAELTETLDTLGKLDVIVINSAWCGYTMDAKRLARGSKIGLFKIGDFMSALNRADYSQHLNDREREVFKENGWL
jgi:hypothetical protein